MADTGLAGSLANGVFDCSCCLSDLVVDSVRAFRVVLFASDKGGATRSSSDGDIGDGLVRFVLFSAWRVLGGDRLAAERGGFVVDGVLDFLRAEGGRPSEERVNKTLSCVLNCVLAPPPQMTGEGTVDEAGLSSGVSPRVDPSSVLSSSLLLDDESRMEERMVLTIQASLSS